MDSAKVTKEDKVAAMEQNIVEGIQEIEDQLGLIGHGQAKRLLMAVLHYPLIEENFHGESEAMIKAFSAAKRVKDTVIALGVEGTIEQMMESYKQEAEALGQTVENGTGENNNG